MNNNESTCFLSFNFKHSMYNSFLMNFIILMMINQNLYMGDFLESFIWSSMDHSKDCLKNNYFIFNFQALLHFFLITFSFPMIFFNSHLLPFLITTSIPFYNYFIHFFYPPTWIWKNNLTCFFSCLWNVY